MYYQKGKVTRDVTPQECHWLSTVIKTGTVVYKEDDLWKCCSPQGVYVTDGGAAFELPADAVAFE